MRRRNFWLAIISHKRNFLFSIPTFFTSLIKFKTRASNLHFIHAVKPAIRIAYIAIGVRKRLRFPHATAKEIQKFVDLGHRDCLSRPFNLHWAPKSEAIFIWDFICVWSPLCYCQKTLDDLYAEIVRVEISKTRIKDLIRRHNPISLQFCSEANAL